MAYVFQKAAQALRYSGAALFVVSLFFAACDGTFDQRTRGDIDALRDGSVVGINTNPASGFGAVNGAVSTAGPVNNARIVLYAVDEQGRMQTADDDVLGNSVTFPGLSAFRASARRAYEGPVIVAVLPADIEGRRTTYSDPAHAKTANKVEMDDDDALLGYALDFPRARNALTTSPLTTLVVERALFLGGISSGNLSLASKQVGEFFGLFEARQHTPFDYSRSNFSGVPVQAEALVIAAFAQLARQAGVAPAKVWLAMRLDIRDDGELNGSIGLIPGSDMAMPDLGAADYIGTELLENGYLAADNDENTTGIDASNAIAGSALRAIITRLDSARSFADTTLEIQHVSLTREVIRVTAGESAALGLHAFDDAGGGYYLVASRDGPSVANLTITSDDDAVAEITPEGRVSVPEGTASGSHTKVTIRVRPDGVFLTGDFDQTLSVTVVVR